MGRSCVGRLPAMPGAPPCFSPTKVLAQGSALTHTHRPLLARAGAATLTGLQPQGPPGGLDSPPVPTVSTESVQTAFGPFPARELAEAAGGRLRWPLWPISSAYTWFPACGVCPHACCWPPSPSDRQTPPSLAQHTWPGPSHPPESGSRRWGSPRPAQRCPPSPASVTVPEREAAAASRSRGWDCAFLKRLGPGAGLWRGQWDAPRNGEQSRDQSIFYIFVTTAFFTGGGRVGICSLNKSSRFL